VAALSVLSAATSQELGTGMLQRGAGRRGGAARRSRRRRWRSGSAPAAAIRGDLMPPPRPTWWPGSQALAGASGALTRC